MADNNKNLEILSCDGIDYIITDAEARAAIEKLDPASVEEKADKVSGAISGDLAALDANGNLTDSGKKTSDFANSSHAHGNIGNGGTLTDTAAAAAGNDYIVIRDDSNNKIQTSTIKGTDVKDAVDKKHSHSSITLSTTAQAYDGTHTIAMPSSDPYTSVRTPASHTHGNITNTGALQTDDVAIADGDKLVVTDASNSSKVARTSVSFDGSTTNTALTPKGTFESFSKFSGSYNDLSNKPTLGTAAAKDVPLSGNATTSQVVMGNDSRLSDSRPASDVSSWAKASSKPSYTKSEVGLGNVTNDAQVKRTEMGANNGVATLDSSGKVPSSQLPSYVDDVIEGYYYNSKFYKESAHTTEIAGETGKIYVDLATEKTYRWSGTAFVVISETLALGETSSTAYRGDRGKTAYDHSQSTHARTDATAVAASSTNGNIKINGTETTVYTHPSGTNPHGTTKSDVGLGNVGNFKAVSTVAGQGLSDTEKSNARANIGAGTSSFSGSYNDLSNKPTIPAAAANGTFSVKTKVGDASAVTAADFTANQSSADDVTFVQGSNVTLTTDTSNRTITIAAKDTTYSAATTSAAGLMSADDKTKLNGIASGATNVTTSTVAGWGYTKNAGTVTQVKVGSTAYDPSSGVVSLPAYPTSLPASDVYSWAKASSKPSYTASDVGLGNVGNFKAVSTVASQGLSSTEQANARANIGAGTSSFSGSYNDLSNKPTIPAAAANGTFSIKTKVGSNNAVVASDFTANQSSADDITFIQGSNVTLTTDTTNRTVTIASTNTTYSTATTSANGLMSSTDKSKLDGIASGATAVSSSTVSGWGFTKNTGTVTQVKIGTTAYNPSSGVISLPAYPTDTNTHRPIQVNGTEVLGNNTTALNLKAGSNVSITNSSGTVTIASTDTNTWRPVGTGATDAAAGNHTHGITLASDSGTSTVNLAANTTYKLTAGGQSIIFKTPADNNTTYSSQAAASDGTAVSLCTTGEKYTWNNKQNALTFATTATCQSIVSELL